MESSDPVQEEEKSLEDPSSTANDLDDKELLRSAMSSYWLLYR